jgi:leucyl aminopeptidase
MNPMKISFAPAKLPTSGTLVLPAGDKGKLPPEGTALDKMGKGFLKRAIASAEFAGKKGETLLVPAPAAAKLDAVLLLGLGKSPNAAAHREAGGALAKALAGGKAKQAALLAPDADAAAELAYGASLRAYRFDKYHTDSKRYEKPRIEKLSVLTAKPAEARKLWAERSAVAEGVAFARDLVSEPPNVLYPDALAKECQKLKELGVEVKVLGKAEMAKLGMNALLGVAQGSAHEARLVVMRWKGAVRKDGPLAFVGKGVTFDTGGISIKPAAGMEDMKFDMGGAAAVVGLMKALAGRKAKADVVGIIGCVENMPSGTAQRPGDVVTSMSGQTIEVINTDAEGRLVLADALCYVQRNFKPAMIVDLATLTGAVMVSLGLDHAGLFSTDDKLAAAIDAAGKETGELVWRMPLHDSFDKQLNSEIADMRNITESRWAGSCTAAQFLARFVEQGTPWAHLDIAGTAWAKKDYPLTPRGATGYGVRLLDTLVARNYEEQ